MFGKPKIITQKKYYVYTYSYPKEMGGHVFYVGKGTGDRMLTHETEAKKGGRNRKCATIRSIWEQGYQVQKMIEYETDDEQDALVFEHESINSTWASSYLTNTQKNPYNPHLSRRERNYL